MIGSRTSVFIMIICVAIEAGLFFYKPSSILLGVLILCSLAFILYLLEYMFMIVFSTMYLINIPEEERYKE